MTLRTRLHGIGRGQTAPKGLHSRDRSSHVRPSPHGVKAGCIFAAYPDLAVEMLGVGGSLNHNRRRLRPGDPLQRVRLPDSTLVARRIRADDDHSRRHSSVPFTARRTGICPDDPRGAFDLSFLSREAPYSRGALVLDETRSALSPQESFVPAILNRCGWVSLSICGGLPERPHGSSPQNSGKVLLYVF